MVPETVVIAGATGLIGKELVGCFLNSDNKKIKLVSRRKSDLNEGKIEEIIVDFENLDEKSERFGADAAFCCLGTTMKKAGSKDAFYRIDHDYVVSFAQQVKNAGAERFFLVSAMGASHESGIFYNKVKGQTEKDIINIGFRELHIFRPSLLLGDRKEKRTGEKIGQLLMTTFEFLLQGPLRKYRAIEAADVARAMEYVSRKDQAGCFVYESHEIKKIIKS